MTRRARTTSAEHSPSRRKARKTRHSQIYIDLGDNSRNDAEPFVMLGRVVEGMT